MSVTEFGYKAFISYSHADKAWAEWLLKSLESYHVPSNLVGRRTDFGLIPARLAPIFRDRDELPAAHRLTDRLFEALRSSEFLIVLCSPRAAKSKLVNREIVEFKKNHGDGRVLCMIVDGVPFADDPAEECFPEALLHSFTSDGRRGGLLAEGLAADFRDEGDGKRMGLLKIVAGMIGVGLNDLVRRDEQRRQRTMIAVATASVIGMSVMGTLTYEASRARETASAALLLAESKAKEAVANRNDAESLLHFMLRDSYNMLLEAGHLSAAEAVTERVLEYYREKKLDVLTPTQFTRMTGAMLKLGQSQDRKGNSARARELFEATLDLSRRYRSQHPRSPEGLFRLQNNLFFTGYLAMRQGRYEEAERDFRERLALIEDIIDNPDLYDGHEAIHLARPAIWEEKKADALRSLGSLLADALGQASISLPLHHEGIELTKQVVKARENAPQTLVDLATAYHFLGQAHLLAGHIDDAEVAFQNRLDLLSDLYEKNPENYRYFRRLLISKQYIARIAALRGDLESALGLHQEAAEGFERLIKKDPINTLWLAGAAHAQFDLAATAFRLGHIDLARPAFEAADHYIKETIERDATRIAYQLDGYRVASLAAEFAAHDGNMADALRKMTEVVDGLNREADSFKQSSSVLEHVAETHLLYGTMLASAGRLEDAKSHWAAGRDALESSPASLSLDAKAALAEIHNRLGEPAKAQPLYAELDLAGYHAPVTALSANAGAK